MKTTIAIITMLISAPLHAQESIEVVTLKTINGPTAKAVATALKEVAKQDKQTEKAKTDTKKTSKPPVDVAELAFKRMDSDKDGTISLKEFKEYWTKRRGSSSRGYRGRSGGQRRGASDARGRSGGRDRSHRGKSKRRRRRR